MLTIACPHCGCQLKAPEEVIGKKAKCVDCGKSFIATRPLGNAFEYATRLAPLGSSKRGNVTALRIIGIILIATILIGGCLVAWFGSRSGRYDDLHQESIRQLRDELDLVRDRFQSAHDEALRLKGTNATFEGERKALSDPEYIEAKDRADALAMRAAYIQREIQSRKQSAEH